MQKLTIEVEDPREFSTKLSRVYYPRPIKVFHPDEIERGEVESSLHDKEGPIIVFNPHLEGATIKIEETETDLDLDLSVEIEGEIEGDIAWRRFALKSHLNDYGESGIKLTNWIEENFTAKAILESGLLRGNAITDESKQKLLAELV